ncbi:hypothetical protein [Micromonospora sp. NPDC049301]|uniref:hypothetical protein n=1 Tax=Micromonospora sp. NPDC049301 TaxID=3155723 RepID=UPI00341C3BC9
MTEICRECWLHVFGSGGGGDTQDQLRRTSPTTRTTITWRPARLAAVLQPEPAQQTLVLQTREPVEERAALDEIPDIAMINHIAKCDGFDREKSAAVAAHRTVGNESKSVGLRSDKPLTRRPIAAQVVDEIWQVILTSVVATRKSHKDFGLPAICKPARCVANQSVSRIHGPIGNARAFHRAADSAHRPNKQEAYRP